MQADAPAAPPLLLDIDDASVAHDGHPALDHLSLRIAPGEHTAVLGANGAGKSTLVQLIAHTLYPSVDAGRRGSVRVFGREHWNVAALRTHLGIVSPAVQDDFTHDATLEVHDAVVSAFFAARGTWRNHAVTAAMHERARAALEQASAAQLEGRRMATLSTGEARRVLIARALVHAPRALLLDEPCAGLDLGSRRAFLETLRGLARGGVTLLLVTHHIEEILPEITRVVLLRRGQVLRQGAKQELLAAPLLSAVYGIPTRVAHHNGWYHASVE